jgi:hypothetical protein
MVDAVISPHIVSKDDYWEMRAVIQTALPEVQEALADVDILMLEVMAATLYRVDVPADMWENVKLPIRTRYRKMVLKQVAVWEASKKQMSPLMGHGEMRAAAGELPEGAHKLENMAERWRGGGMHRSAAAIELLKEDTEVGLAPEGQDDDGDRCPSCGSADRTQGHLTFWNEVCNGAR